MTRRPKIELLTPDLDLALTFIPGYDLLEQQSALLSAAEIQGIALALWELTGNIRPSSSAWKQSQSTDSLEGNNP